MPLAWGELKKADLRTKFDLKSAVARLRRQKADPWKDYWSTRQRITKKILHALGA